MKIAKKAAVVLCASLMLISSGVVSQQAYEEFPATLTVNAAATEHNISEGNVIINDSGEHIITGETATNTITIEGGTPTVTVKDVNITLSEGCPLTVHSTDFTLIIEGENTFKSGSKGAGIDVAEGNKITIKENEGVDGTLNATGADSYPGIGGGKVDGGTIIIEGGTVTANGGRYGAGIGGGYYGGGGEVIVNGGTVTATGGHDAAGIGGGNWSDGGGTFTIYDGTVTATGGHSGAGIGGGYFSGGGEVIVNGGTVNANGGQNGAGIGGGYHGNGGTVTIYGGTVNANGGTSAAGIGGGYNGKGGTVLVNKGTVTATGGDDGAGIGGGWCGNGGNFTINNGNVTATAGKNGKEDIGGGNGISTSGTATYNGGIVNDVDYNPPPGYTVTIPSTVTLGGSIKIEVSDVVLGDYKSVNVDLFKASGTGNTLALSCDGKEITYAIKKDDATTGEPVNVGDTVLSATENSSVTLYFTEPTKAPEYAGDYTGTVTFKFSMEAQ